MGAEVVDGGVHFRLWAPSRGAVAVVLDDRDIPLQREERGYFSALIRGARAGARYRFRLDGEPETYPDPASRFQPQGPHGPSEVIDPSAYRWRDADWRGVGRKGLVLYELHVGTFTPEGTYAAAAQHLPHLADVGVNLIEVMPVHEFPGAFGWGYDGVDLWAPTHLYGTPDELRALVDQAHAHGIGVILDVVYNHFGPDGCYLKQFTPSYFTDRYENDWGEAINFDGEDAAGVREFFRENAAYWIDEFHFDGLRLDATQSINDASERHILEEISACTRGAYLVAENEPQDRTLLTRFGLDAMWNDDWHHAAMVALTGNHEAYYTDYRGRPQEFVSMAKLGFLYQGQWYKWQKQRRGTPSQDIDPARLVCFIQNHDQIANSARGERVHEITSPGKLRAMTALLLLQPQTPMLFQGQEFGAPSPFTYFADHRPELAKLVREGRAEFMRQFPSVKGVPPPEERATFESCILDHAQRDEAILRLHRELIALRRTHPFREQRSDWLQGAVLGEECFVLRWLAGDADERLLLVSLGAALHLDPAPEPLLAPPHGFRRWEVMWATERIAHVDTEENWKIPGEAAVVLRPSA